MTVDAHHHFWNPERIPQGWMTGEHAVIARTFEPPDLEPLLRAAGVTRTVLVQSAARDDDTDYMFELADGVPWVGGIIAWCRLDDADAARARLGELRARPKLRGIRHLIHQEPDPHWILQPHVEPGLLLLEETQLVLELPAEYPRHLADVPELARRHPQLAIVIDHLGKPPLGSEAMSHWEELLRSAAGPPNVYAKVSGLNTVAPRPLGRGRPRARGERRRRRLRPRPAGLRKRLARSPPERRLRDRVVRDDRGRAPRGRPGRRPDPQHNGHPALPPRCLTPPRGRRTVA